MKSFAIFAIALMSCFTPTTVTAIELAGTPVEQSATKAGDVASPAMYEGRTIDLRAGWGTASACVIDERSAVTCFDTEKEMDQFIAVSVAVDDASLQISSLRAASLAATCSTSLRLYDGISYTSSVLAIYSRFTVVNLSNFGFSNATTSYKVGACAVTMWDGTTGSGSVYPGNMSAGAQSASMATGWNNRISSVYLW